MRMSFFHTICVSFLSVILAAGCSEENVKMSPSTGEGRAKVFPLLEGNADENADELEKLKYKLFYFRSDEKAENPEETLSGEYHYMTSTEEWLDYAAFQKYVVNISNEWVERYDYRLVAIATPADGPEIELGFTESETDSLLKNLYVRRIFRNGKLVPLSQHNYIGVGDLTREAVESGVIPIHFTHAIGQLVFDFNRCDNQGNPLALDKGYSSTLDRVKKIEVKVENYTRSVKWDGADCRIFNDLPELCVYNTSVFLDDDDWKVDWSKAIDNKDGKSGWISPGTKSGSSRFYGPFQLTCGLNHPSELKVTLTFHYADTFLPNGETTTSSINLSLPREGKELAVKINAYTVTTVKIKENRIIDVPKEFGDVTIIPDWSEFIQDKTDN